jgi:hypothetical protein
VELLLGELAPAPLGGDLVLVPSALNGTPVHVLPGFLDFFTAYRNRLVAIVNVLVQMRCQLAPVCHHFLNR